MFVLPIFPRSGFDQSVTTPVLVGVLASWFFCETLGWVFAGLVVPGYLASVFLLEPTAGAIDVFEAVLTYVAARAIGEYLPRLGVTSRIFGRERFFLVVLVSILVRLAVEGWLLPRFVPHVTWAYSVGLVVVPLTANACWKTGLVRGAIQNGIPTLCVYLALKWVLVPWTNLSLAGFELSTENLAAGFLSSPKAYILLLTGAMLAAQANLRYGWDFNGILVPALLGLAIVEPIKFAATFAETLLLVFVVWLVVKLTPLKRANLEGPRRIVLYFSVDYMLRFVWAATMGRRLPGGDIVAFMGFGYLLPTLLAVKIAQRSSAPLVLLPTLKVSILGFVLGSLVGFGGHLLDRADTAQAATIPRATRSMPHPPDTPAAAALWVSQLAVEGLPEPDSNVTGDLAKLPQLLDDVAHARPRPEVEAATLNDGIFLVREKFDTLIARHGTPSILFRGALPDQPVIALVPTPLACPTCAALAGQLVHTGEVDVVVIAGIEEPVKKAWLDVETTAHAAARVLAGKDAPSRVLAIREHALLASKETRAVGPAVPRIHAAAPHFPGSGLVTYRGDITLTFDAATVAASLAPARPAISLESATDVATTLEPVRAATHPGELEHLVALRRLVLDPMLSPDASPAQRALLPFAAGALGYSLTAPARWGTSEGIALLPAARGLPIAVFARTTGVQDTIVEAPTGSRDGVRDLAVRLAFATDADALVIGEVYDGAMRAGAVRAAHGAATNGRTPTVFLVREDKSSNDARIATWMDDGKASALGHAALERLGVPVTETAPDLATRDLASRTLLEPTAVVAITAGGKSLVRASLDATRRAHALLPTLPSRDGTVADVARGLVKTVEGKGPVMTGIEEVVRRAAAEGSVTAIRTMNEQMAKGALGAAIARTKEGSFIVAVARTERGQFLIAAPLDASDVKTERRASIGACFTNPVVPGICEAPK